MRRNNLSEANSLICSILFGLMLSIISCTNGDKNNASVTSDVQKEDLQEVISKIKEQNSRFERFYLNGQADSLGLVFDKNVKQYLSHQPPTNNLNELIKNNKLLMSWGQWKFNITTDEVKLSGQLAIERGRYKLSFTPNEDSPIPASLDSGNYIVLWEKIDDDWKIVWDAPVTETPLE